MSVLTPKRLLLCVVAVLTATTALASHPSPRTYARAAWDEQNRLVVLFGGRGGVDAATGVAHASDETWVFAGAAWAQRFPLTTPPGRSAHAMTYDSTNHRVLMFSGRQEEPDPNGDPMFLNDLWAWDGEDWSRLDADVSERPKERTHASIAWNPKTNRIVLYGGAELIGRDSNNISPLYDTWEFVDGAWTRIATDTPKVNRPILTYNPITEKIYMIGANTGDGKVLMYRYDDGTWTDLAPSKTPPCVVEGFMPYAPDRQRLLFIGGICATGTPGSQELYEYDAAANVWNKLTIPIGSRGIGQAAVYDTFRGRIVFFGGTAFGGATLTAFTTILNNLRWQSTESFHNPGARSMHIFEADPSRNGIWMFGGLLESGGGNFYGDFWGWQNGQWFLGPDHGDAPVACDNPVGARDSDRDRLVIACLGSGIWEWDGTEWDSMDNVDPSPDERRFSAMVYDKRLKKMVLFGGFFGNGYYNDTWTWDGTKWVEIEIPDRERPQRRSSMAMWYDPLMERTILYSGIGRPNLNERVTRFSDMWAFDGTRWTKLDVTTPGVRFRPQIAVHPVTGKLTMFGGLRSENIDADSIRQFFDNDMWEWDGAARTWTQIDTGSRRPPVRQNGGMAWDPATGKLVLFGGYAKGFYLSDTWLWDGTTWSPRLESIAGRRRAVR